MKNKRCKHPKRSRYESSIRIPAVWGSWGVEICRKCKAWRELSGIKNRWRKDSLKAASKEENDE